jgi:nucleotide-binding universal stress UspA family protein
VADAILAAAEAIDAGLIVAGGYGHSRMHEWALGGVTQGLLTHSPKPVLFSH